MLATTPGTAGASAITFCLVGRLNDVSTVSIFDMEFTELLENVLFHQEFDTVFFVNQIFIFLLVQSKSPTGTTSAHAGEVNADGLCFARILFQDAFDFRNGFRGSLYGHDCSFHIDIV